MTSANMDAVKQSVAAFKSLGTNDQLATLALIYSKVSGSIPQEAVGTASPEVSGLVSQIEQMSQERQVDALGDLLSAGKSDQGEITLDPNPAQALTELVSGGNTVPTGQYGSMDTQSKLTLWYQVGKKLGSTMVAIPSDFSPSSKVTELLQSLGSLDVDQQMSFLTQVI